MLRLKPAPEAPVLLRSYSLSGEPSEERWRVSIKREPNGAVGAYVEVQLRVGDIIDKRAARQLYYEAGHRPCDPV